MELNPRQHLKVEQLEVERLVDALFVLGTLAFLIFMYRATYGLELGTYLLPRIVILYIATLLIVYLAYAYTPVQEPVDALLGISSDTTKTIGGIEFVPTFKEIVWFVCYLLSLVYVGFFTTNFLYVTSYIFIRDDYDVRRIYIPATYALVIDAFLYLLIVDYLRSSAVFRLGFLI